MTESQISPPNHSFAPSERWLYALIFVLPFLAYQSVLTHHFGYTDDYPAATGLDPLKEAFNVNNIFFRDGRPLMSIITVPIFGLVDSVGDLTGVRFLNVLGLALCSVLSYFIFRRQRLSPPLAFLIACLFVMNPSGGVCAGWAITVSYPFSILLSLGGMAVWFRALDNKSFAWGLFAWFLLIVAFFTYQPTALIGTTLLATRHLGHGSNVSWKAHREWFYSLTFITFVLATYYVLYKAYLPLLELPSDTLRSDVVKDYAGKLSYYFTGPLRESLLGWASFWPNEFANRYLVLLLLLASVPFARVFHKKGLLHGCVLLGLFIATLLLASSTVLVPHKNTAQFRVFFPIITLVSGLYAIAVYHFIKHWEGKKGAWLSVSLMVLAMLLTTNYYVKRGIAVPHSKEVHAHKTYLQEEIQSPPQRVLYVHPIGQHSDLSEVRKVHEYGLYSSWLPWVPHHLLNLLLEQQFPEIEGDLRTIDVIQVYPWQAYRVPQGVPVIDGLKVLSGTPSPPYTTYKRNLMPGMVSVPQTDPFLGEMEMLNKGWRFSKNFGFFRKRADSRYYLLEYGVFKITKDTDSDDILFFENEEGKKLKITKSQTPANIRSSFRLSN